MPDIDYLIGILDGEGCFTIRIHKGMTKTLGMRVRFQPQASISNTDLKLINYVKEILTKHNIKFSCYLKKKKYPNKLQYEVMIYPTALRKLIPLIFLRPYFAKRREAEILMEALDLTQKHKSDGFKGGWGRQPLTTETLKKFDALRTELVGLHGRQAKSLIKLKAEDFVTDLDVAREKARDGWKATKPQIK